MLRKLLRFVIYNKIFSLSVSSKARIGKKSRVHYSCNVDKYCKIGSYTFIAKNTLITSSSIGNYCSIGPNVKIGLGEHSLENFSTSTVFSDNPFKELTSSPCEIKNDVWIGTGAVILRGVKVGNGVVIGANAVVTKDIPDYAVAVGVPAKILKFRLNKDLQDYLNKTEWWNKNPAEIKKIMLEK